MEKQVYIITDYDNDKSKAVAISEEQARAINWLIDWLDLSCSCEIPKYEDCEEI